MGKKREYPYEDSQCCCFCCICLCFMMGKFANHLIHYWSDILSEGDVLVTNHPSAGGSHLPDITVVAPVFSMGSWYFFVANRGHTVAELSDLDNEVLVKLVGGDLVETAVAPGFFLAVIGLDERTTEEFNVGHADAETATSGSTELMREGVSCPLVFLLGVSCHASFVIISY